MKHPVLGSGILPLVYFRNEISNFVTSQEEPFIVETTHDERQQRPGVRYKGYCIDLLNELQSQLNFRYEIHLVHDGTYGGYDPTTGAWNGMVGELMQNVRLKINLS